MNNNWMDKNPLGVLASTTDFPKDTVKIEKRPGCISVDKRRLMEDYNDGAITLEEFQIELSVLNSVEK